MQKVKNLYGKIKSWSLRKKIIYGLILIVVLLVGYMIFKPKDNSANTSTDIAKIINLKQTVLATGQVTSNTDLNLSFNASGIVKNIRVKVGDVVKKGDILATLDQASESAALTSARGALAAAKARYNRILEGSTNEEIALAKVNLEQTKLTQNTLVKNAYKNLLNSTPEAVPENETDDYEAPTISGTYSLDKEGKIYLNMYYSSGGVSYAASGLTEGTGVANIVTPQPIGNSGLYIKFSSDSSINTRNWVIEIPNKKAADYLTNYNAYEATLAQAKFAIDQKQAELDLKKAYARQSDIDLANADIISAEGQVELATAKYNDTMIKAPADGTITSVDIKIGELAQVQKESIVLQDITNIYLEANVNEANITSINIGAPVDITFDAFGTDQIYKGEIVKIDPASTLISGVVNYKITANVSNVSNLRPGMTANMTILAGEKDNVLAIPSRAVIKNDNKETVRLVTNTKTKAYKEVPVETGMEGDGGLVEIKSGLNEGEEIVTLIKQ